jgi:hypothetical protein
MSRALTSSRKALVASGLWLAAVALLTPGVALAYVGPGLGLGAISSFLALVGGVLLGILGFIWYPFKRLLRAMKKRKEPEAED